MQFSISLHKVFHILKSTTYIDTLNFSIRAAPFCASHTFKYSLFRREHLRDLPSSEFITLVFERVKQYRQTTCRLARVAEASQSLAAKVGHFCSPVGSQDPKLSTSKSKGSLLAIFETNSCKSRPDDRKTGRRKAVALSLMAVMKIRSV